jgi:FKBP12-rapamycin complex-associated protein
MTQDDPLKDSSTRQMTAPLTMLGIPAEEYFQTVVMSSLLNILQDGTLVAQYFGVIEVIMTIFKTQGLKCASFLPKVSNLSALFLFWSANTA